MNLHPHGVRSDDGAGRHAHVQTSLDHSRIHRRRNGWSSGAGNKNRCRQEHRRLADESNTAPELVKRIPSPLAMVRGLALG